MPFNPIAKLPERVGLTEALKSSAMLGKHNVGCKVVYSIIKKKEADAALLAKLDRESIPLVIGPSGLFTSNGWGYQGKFYLDQDNKAGRKGKSFRFIATPDHGPFRGAQAGLLRYLPSTTLIFSEANINLPSLTSELTRCLEQRAHANVAVSHKSAALLAPTSAVDQPISTRSLSRRRALWAMLSTFVVQAVLLILLVECASIKDFSLLTLMVQGVLWLVSVYFFLLACAVMGRVLTTQRLER